VSVAAVPNGDGRLRVTVATNGPGNELRRVTFGTDARTVGNGLIDAPAPAQPVQTQAAPPLSITFPPATPAYTFFLGRATPRQATTVPFSVEDRCRTQEKFVGGGPDAF
jgi:hypothetical protein